VTSSLAHYGDATLTVEVHDGLIEYVLDLDHIQLLDDAPRGHIRIRFADAGARDTAHCFADVFPYSYVHPPLKPHPAPGAAEARRCDYCHHKLAQIFDGDRGWCGIECQVNDRLVVVRCPLFARDDCDATFTDRPVILHHLQGWPHYRTRAEAETLLALAEEVAP
jgi:hypothetical protein